MRKRPKSKPPWHLCANSRKADPGTLKCRIVRNPFQSFLQVGARIMKGHMKIVWVPLLIAACESLLLNGLPNESR